jgi:pyruvate dehydrogenase E1 component alpha subunit
MPREKIALDEQIEYLSILNEEGIVDQNLEPKIPLELHLKLYRAMLLGRRFDERMIALQRQGRIGTFAPITGQEASHVPAVAVLKPSDWLVPAFREMAAELWRGRSMESVVLYFNGYNEGIGMDDQRKDLPIAVPVGSQIPHAVGLGMAAKYRRQNEVVMVFFGDGATSQGDFHEGLNFAGVFQVPVVFVCQNNQWAISTPLSKQTRSKTLAQKAIAYGLPGIRVDGNDVLAVYAAASEAVDRARSGGGPTLIECVTYRLLMHTTADDPRKYRKEEEVELWKKRDPISRYQKHLTGKGILTEDMAAKMENDIKEEIRKAVERAEETAAGLGDPLDMFDHVFSEMPQTLREQKEELARELAENREKEGARHE